MKNRFTLLIAFCLMALTASAQLVDVITGLQFPYALALDGNDLYISVGLSSNGKIAKLDITQPNPTLTTVVQISTNPGGLVINGNDLFFTKFYDGIVSKINITQTNPTVTDIVDLTGTAGGLLLSGNELFISNENQNEVVKIDYTQPNPTPSTLVTGLSGPFGIAKDGNNLYISEFAGGKVVKVDLSQMNPAPVNLVTGLSQPGGLTLNGKFLYIAHGGSFAGKISRVDVTQTLPMLEDIVGGLSNPRLCAFDGIDLYIAEAGSSSAPTGKISKLEIGQPTFSTQPTICANAVPTDLGGASPTGGSYSGPGVTDDGNGETFTFDPVAAGGAGTYTVTYTAINGQTATSTLTVVASPTAMFTPPSPVIVDAGVQTGLGGGTPTGGVYSGTGITDDGNGMTYSFDPMAAGVGTHTITYSYTDGNGCSDMAEGVVEVNAAIPPDNECSGANDINALFGQAENEPQTSSLYDNTGYNSTGDPATGYECFDDGALERTTWYSFMGDGNNYRIKTIQCTATNYITNGDTQMAVYSGDCANPTAVACSEDEDFGNQIYNANLELQTVAGTNYLIMIDGWSGTTYSAEGEFCLEVTNLTPNAVTDIKQTDIQIFPNPTTGEIQMRNVDADQVQIFDGMGRLLFSEKQPGNTLDLSAMPAGVYFLKITEGKEVYSARVVKE